MDFNQRKLSKSEWESIEHPVSEDEIEVLKLIMNGYFDVNISYNKCKSLFTLIKIEYSEQIEDYLFKKYFEQKISSLSEKYSFQQVKITANLNIKKADLIRIQNNTVENLENSDIYESILLKNLEKMLKCLKKKDDAWMNYYYTLHKLIRNKVHKINRHIVAIINQVLNTFEEKIQFEHIIKHSVEYIEKNDYLLKYSDITLYEHQKEIFTAINTPGPKLVLYIAPTGTGKTITPIGISSKYKVIFVCAARHVGLALAKAAVSIHKKVAFAFGCSCSEDIRLHYFAAKEYTKNYKTGGIWKVDNTIGDKVEIMICDIKSYEYAMLYMLAFNPAQEIVTYWDEPTITLDYSNHEFHDIINKNWRENLIPNMVLSSATLPKLHELPDTISSFKEKFPEAVVHNIISHDCKKSIPILNKDGYVVLPHMLHEDFVNVQEVVKHCENYLTLLRYFDLDEVVKFIMYLQTTNYIPNSSKIGRHFATIEDVNMTNIKLYYLKLLKNVYPSTWGAVYLTMRSFRKKKICPNEFIDSRGNKLKKANSIGPGSKVSNNLAGSELVRIQSEQLIKKTVVEEGVSGNCAIYVTTKDAYTLTDGPTIFLANDVTKVAKFCIQQANIPEQVMNDILQKINFNNEINEKIGKLQKDMEDIIEKKMGQESEEKTKKQDRIYDSPELYKIKKELEMLSSMIKIAKLNDTFIPNMNSHLKKWAEEMKVTNAFTCSIDEVTINKIMLLNNVDNSWKILLLMGIGVFTEHESVEYTQIMKSLAEEQHLYMIIASSDYIYGTNYQFCHGYLSKDMELTQEKIIQAMGRIGRNKIQQDYTVRFRDDEQIKKLFTSDTEKPEVANMNRLFC